MGNTDRKSVQKQTVVDDDSDIFETIIFTLAPMMGGRDQVLATPFIEAIKYVEMELAKRKADRWNGFMDRMYTNRANFDKKKQHLIQEYAKTIQPEQARKQLEMKTDMDQLKELLKEQEHTASIKLGG